MDSEFWAAIVGAIVGALAGGLISYLLQRQVLLEARNDRIAEGDSRKKAVALRLLFHLQSAFNDLEFLARHVEEAQETAGAQGWQLWQALYPIANLPRRIEYSSDEFALLVDMNNYPLLNNVRDVEVLHESAIDSFSLFHARKSELGTSVGARMYGNAGLGQMEMNEDQLIQFGPLLADVRGLADSIGETCRKDADTAHAALHGFNDALMGVIGRNFDLAVMKRGEGAAVQEAAPVV